MAGFESSVYLKVGSDGGMFKPPDRSLTMSPTSWGSSTQLVNGSNATIASEYSARTYNLSWDVLDGKQFDTLDTMMATAGTKEVYYLDGFQVVGNIVSPLAGKPYLLSETLSPVVYDTNGIQLASNVNGELVFKATAATDNKEHKYVEKIVVPAGYRATIKAWGTNTERVLTFNGVAVSAARTTSVVARTDQIVELVIKPAGLSATLTKICVTLTKFNEAEPTNIQWSRPRGTTSLRVVPGSYSVTGITTAFNGGLYTASVDIVEVWPWL